MKAIDRILARIANLCVINCNSMYDPELKDGTAGAVVFLYEYARHSGCAEYAAEAGRLLLDTLDEAIEQKAGVETAAQIGLAFNYLVWRGHTEIPAEAEQLLAQVRNTAKGTAQPFAALQTQTSDSYFWQGLYLASEIKRTPPDKTLFATIDKALDAIGSAYTDRALIPISLSNSVLLFIVSLCKSNVLAEKAENVGRKMGRYVSGYLQIPAQSQTDKIVTMRHLLAASPMRHSLSPKFAAPKRTIGSPAKHADISSMRLWPEIIYPQYGRRIVPDTAALEADMNYRIDDFSIAQMPHFIKIGLYLLGVRLSDAMPI